MTDFQQQKNEEMAVKVMEEVCAYGEYDSVTDTITIRHDELSEAIRRAIEQSITRSPQYARIDKWLPFDGDMDELQQFIDNIGPFDWYKKAGQDRGGCHVIFLKDGDATMGAIRARSNRSYQMALKYLKENHEYED